ncbi:transposase [Hymenobacter lutimineralis]|uniref:Transposase n=1 Tax=Hymenobacter lutimineralis TaxID=2606448 RepID=A0A5D6UU84_9BACT|nr:helix-turn-helix domain-containing protein [Hymenobacter lutimineralis]TYZ07053.1 transposase [Hymenobacter lutimineralis]
MQAYSLDLRQRVAQALAEPGARQAQVAARFCVSLAFVGKLLRRQRHTGSLAALPGRGGPPRCLDAAGQAWLVAQVGRQSDVTLAELRDALAADTGQRVSVGSVWRVLDEHGLRRKKKPARHRA